jgi:penicillin-binding protein 1C
MRSTREWCRGALIGVFTALAAAVTTGMAAVFWPAAAPEFSAIKAAYTPSDAYLLDRYGAVVDSERIRFDVRRLQWVSLTDISPALVAAIVDGEDRRFWQHHGVDWKSALGAIRDQVLLDRRRGASTITMQLAKLLEPPRGIAGAIGRWQGKFAQIRLAVALEAHWSKPQLLEAYLNMLGYRGELQGIGAAAQRLAGTTPASLSLPESMVLAALLPETSANPERVSARACARASSLRLEVGCRVIRDRASAMLASTAEPPPDRLAPQVAHALLRAPGERLQTTLDAGIQRLARDTLRTHLAALVARNVRDGAAIVVNNATGEVLAYVGSAGPYSRAPHVDGVRAARQAGSTLKPFLYELALERQYLTAASLLDDSPLNLESAAGIYIPQDYDHDFKGLVSVRTALASSLNVPAVRALVLVGVDAFRDRLHEVGYAGITEDGDYYGYSLALGSAEVTLWEQAQAYRALARGGEWSALTLLPTRAPVPVKTVLPAAPSFVVADILGDHAARAVTFGLDNHLNTPFWSAAKTGTSKDMRDNWCVGFSQQYTVAVWVGNFEGDPMHDVSGVTGAAPVWHDLMAALQREGGSMQRAAPPGVIAAQIRYSPAVEPGRREWFVGVAPANPIVAVASQGEIARIESPANGVIIALDPDIPQDHQRVGISVRGADAGMKLRLNDQLLGAAVEQRLWAPRPGAYRLTLEDSRGRALDHVLFTVRAASM